MGRCHGHRRGFEFGFEAIPEALMAMKFAGRGPWSDWGREFGRGFGPGAGRGRGRRRMFESGELRLVLLRLIADEPRHGYDLMRAIEEMTGGAYSPSPGIVYPTLTLLEDMGHIEAQDGGGARKAFAATADGHAHLEEKAEEVEGLMERLRELGEPRKRADGAPISRAVGNLLAALWHRIKQDDADEDRLHAIAAILDDAAQQIERLK